MTLDTNALLRAADEGTPDPMQVTRLCIAYEAQVRSVALYEESNDRLRKSMGHQDELVNALQETVDSLRLELADAQTAMAASEPCEEVLDVEEDLKLPEESVCDPLRQTDLVYDALPTGTSE